MENQQVLVSKSLKISTQFRDMTGQSFGAQAGSSGYLNFEGQPELTQESSERSEGQSIPKFQ